MELNGCPSGIDHQAMHGNAMKCSEVKLISQLIMSLEGPFSFPTYLNELLAVIGCEVLVFDSLDGRELVPYQDKVSWVDRCVTRRWCIDSNGRALRPSSMMLLGQAC